MFLDIFIAARTSCDGVRVRESGVASRQWDFRRKRRLPERRWCCSHVQVMSAAFTSVTIQYLSPVFLSYEIEGCAALPAATTAGNHCHRRRSLDRPELFVQQWLLTVVSLLAPLEVIKLPSSSYLKLCSLGSDFPGLRGGMLASTVAAATGNHHEPTATTKPTMLSILKCSLSLSLSLLWF